MTPRKAAATALAFLLIVGIAAAAAAPHATSGGSLPSTAGFPESITTAPTGKTYYASSFTTGAVYKGTVGAAAHLFLAAGANARTSATGVKLDQHGRLYVLTGSGSHLQVFNARSGQLEVNLGAEVQPGQNLNDLAITPTGDIYITDFTTPRIYRVKASVIARGRGKISPWLTPNTSKVPNLKTGNLNGIALTVDDKYLIVGQTGNGALYRIGLSNRSIHRINVHGADLTGSDGILLIDHTLYVVRHSNAVAVLRLNSAYTGGHPTRTLTDSSLDLPTSIAPAGKRLLITNALAQPGATSIQITSLRGGGS
jgi:sugar lactone lactonase YvrE